MTNFINRFWWLFLGVGVGIASWPLFMKGFFGISDDIHVAWLYEMDRALRFGQFPPRFVPDLSFGYGYPLFHFVYPLPFYIAEILHLLGLSLVESIKGVFFLSIVISGIGMYCLVRRFASPLISLAASIVYILTPYRALDLYVRGAIGEIVAFAILPFVFLSIVMLTTPTDQDPRDTQKLSLRWIGIGGISIAALVLSHNITTYLVLPFALLLGFLMIIGSKYGRTIRFIQLFIAVVLGLGISSYFWLPALVDSRLLQYSTVFNFWDHFPSLRQLITPYWGYGSSQPGNYDGMSFFLGVTNLVLLIGGVIISMVHWKAMRMPDKMLIIWVYMSVGVALIFMNYRSSFLWYTIPLIGYFQFPWRFLILTTVVIPCLVIAIKYVKWSTPIIVVLLGLTVVTSWFMFKPQDFLLRDDTYYLNRYIPVPQASEAYKLIQEEYLRLPLATQLRPSETRPGIIASSSAITNLNITNPLAITFTVESSTPSTIVYSKYAFPGWVAKVATQPTRIDPQAPYGNIGVTVPPGIHQVSIAFTETPFWLFFDFVSVICLGLAFIFMASKRGYI